MRLQTAISLGEEWLGADSNILKCSRLGVALHHGALKTAYRKEIERLLRDGVLKVTISSPTLAQGLNLSATAIVMHSLHRSGTKIEVSELKNVIGRAGRAFVDLEGLVLHPIFEDPRGRRHGEWVALIEDLGSRELESGLARLVQSLLLRMHARIGGDINRLVDYAGSPRIGELFSEPGFWAVFGGNDRRTRRRRVAIYRGRPGIAVAVGDGSITGSCLSERRYCWAVRHDLG